MSHEIDVSTGQAAVFVAGEPAWHRLGKVIKEAATSAQAIKLAGLDWTVEQWPVFAHAPLDPTRHFAQRHVPCPGRVANVRTDTKAVLGVVGNQYRVFQNAEAFDFMDAIVDEKLAMYETAGSLKGGRRVWMLARIPKDYRVGDDVVEPYVLLTNAHDGTQSLRVFPTTVRVVCQNTLNLALGRAGTSGLSIPHWPALENRVREARQKLGIITSRLDQFGREMEALSDRQMTSAEVKDYFRGLFPTETKPQAAAARGIPAEGILDRILEEQTQQEQVVGELLHGHYARTAREAQRNAEILDTLLETFESDRNRLPGVAGSAWAAYNSVSEWADHVKPTRGKSEAERDDNRLNSIWFGTANEVKQQAYESALELLAN